MAKVVVGAEVTVGTDQASKSVGSLKQQLREAQAAVAAISEKFGETSIEAANAAKKAAELKDRIGDAKALTEAFNPDKKFQAFSSALQGVVGGFTAIQGAQALLGVKSEELEKTLLKVQGAMALSQGLSAITESIDGFKNLKTVALSTFNSIRAAIGASGIGILVIALGAIVMAMMDYAKSTDSAEAAAERLKKQEEELEKSIANTNKEIDNRNNLIEYQLQKELEYAKGRGASLKELRSIESKYWYEKRLNAQTDVEDAQREVEQLKADGYVKGKLLEDATKQLEDKRQAWYKINQQYNLAEAKQKTEDYTTTTENNKKKLDNDKKYLDDLRKAKQDAFLAGITDDQERAKEQLRLNYENRKLELQQSEYTESQKYELLKQAAIKYWADLAVIDNNAKQKQKDDTDKWANEALNDLIDNIDANIKIEQAGLDARAELQKTYYEAVSAGIGILKMFSEKNKGLQKAALIAENAITIARIILDTQKANAAVTAKYAGIPGGIVAASAERLTNRIKAGIGIATAIAATAKGLQGIGGGGSANGGSAGAGSEGGTSAPIQPQMASTTLNQAQINQLSNAANRSFVLESDVSGNQERIRRLNRAARIN